MYILAFDKNDVLISLTKTNSQGVREFMENTYTLKGLRTQRWHGELYSTIWFLPNEQCCSLSSIE